MVAVCKLEVVTSDFDEFFASVEDRQPDGSVRDAPHFGRWISLRDVPKLPFCIGGVVRTWPQRCSEPQARVAHFQAIYIREKVMSAFSV